MLEPNSTWLRGNGRLFRTTLMPRVQSSIASWLEFATIGPDQRRRVDLSVCPALLPPVRNCDEPIGVSTIRRRHEQVSVGSEASYCGRRSHSVRSAVSGSIVVARRAG